LPTTPALPDLSGVDWAALARMGTPKPAPKPAVVTKPATTTRPTRGAGWSGKR
jgi:hypothetical protein